MVPRGNIMTMGTIQGKRAFVVGISAVSGGGKTAVAKKLSELLPDSFYLCFDDYDDTSIHPENLQKWFADGADYNAWETPVLISDLERLITGRHVESPVKFVVFDAPLGRAHFATGRFIDFMVFIDTPLDVAMARRLLRDLPGHGEQGPEDTMTTIKAGVSSYLNGGRPLYLAFGEQIRGQCDLVLDGCLKVEELASAIRARILPQIGE